MQPSGRLTGVLLREVVGVADDPKGQFSVSFLVLKVSAKAGSNLVVSQVVASIREINGSIAAFKSAVVVGHLPKTRSGKILHGTVAHIADDAPWTLPATVDDPVNASCCRR